MNLIEKANQYFMQTYKQFPIVFEKGEGVYLYDQEGNKYLDFTAGIAVNALGYQDQAFNDALIDQVKKFIHCSNLYYNEPAIETAELLVKKSGLDKVFFCNSGAEAIEAALKLAKKYALQHKGSDCYKIISMQQSFHGRTMGALTATGQRKYQKGFNPLIPGVTYVPFNDYESLLKEVDATTCAIIIEPIQGEGGIYEVDKDYLSNVRALCDEKEIVLIFDEVQCGIGRTGTLFAYENYQVKPDIVALAKGLGAGVPIGAIIAKDTIANVFEPGSHASTFGGNPLVCAAAKTVLEKVGDEAFLQNIKEVSAYLEEQLDLLVEAYDEIKIRRGKGLMQGVVTTLPVMTIVGKAIEKGLLLIRAGEDVLRFVPPLVITKAHIDEMISILKPVIEEVINES